MSYPKLTLMTSVASFIKLAKSFFVIIVSILLYLPVFSQEVGIREKYEFVDIVAADLEKDYGVFAKDAALLLNSKAAKGSNSKEDSDTVDKTLRKLLELEAKGKDKQYAKALAKAIGLAAQRKSNLGGDTPDVLSAYEAATVLDPDDEEIKREYEYRLAKQQMLESRRLKRDYKEEFLLELGNQKGAE
ncbi:hypothetical protein MLD52_12830 [Puniceicoccaceae bacterium K14]|nr:hypothetical protein [Puniceicoccaceae bacterium K14]